MWERCPKCPSRGKPADEQKYVVPGVGDDEASTMAVLEGPGRQENNMHKPLVGKSGDECDGTYFPAGGLRRGEIWITNAFKCHWADSSDTPSPDVIQSCADFHLRRELRQIKPSLVVLMGGIANRLAGLDVDLEHGFLHKGISLLGHTCDVFSTYHPALGMHKSSAMLALLSDFRALRMRTEVPIDEFPKPKFKALVTAREVKAELGDWYDEDIAVDTESIKRWKGFPSTIRYTGWCAQFCRAYGSAFLVRVQDEGAWSEFGRQITKYRRVYMHNADHDENVLRGQGVQMDWDRIRDTMQLAYHDGRVPKGLKALAYRLLGCRMRAFEDVVRPYGMEQAVEWLGNAMCEDWPDAVQDATGEWAWRNCKECGGKGWITRRAMLKAIGFTGKVTEPNKHLPCKDCKEKGKIYVENMTRRKSIGDKMRRLVVDLHKNPDTDVWERWNGWGESNPADIHTLVDRLGAIPLPSVDQVPESEILQYACADAHNTLRIAPILRARVAEIRRRVRGAK